MERRVGFFFHLSFLAHENGAGHPERSQRLTAICDSLRHTGCWEELVHCEPPMATGEQLALVHPNFHIEEIETACRVGPTSLDPDTVASPGSWEAACRAAGAVTAAVDKLMAGTLDAAFCAVRPPGHHALSERASGFCLFNNVAIGARYAQQRHGLQRILIVGWDAHHGNGTQAIFFDDPTVFYASTHQFPSYPGTGAADEVGGSHGMGFTLNLPLSSGAGDREILQAFQTVLLPKALAFKPQMVLISAGFDAHRDDSLAWLSVTESGFAQLTRVVRTIADASAGGRIVSVLEGGYHLGALGVSVDAHLRALLEDSP